MQAPQNDAPLSRQDGSGATRAISLDTIGQMAPDQHPAVVYLNGLSAGSRRTAREALNVIARIIVPGIPVVERGQRGKTDRAYLEIPWAALRFQHVAAIRTRLVEHYAPATVNRMLAALRNVLGAARRLGLMSADDCAAAGDGAKRARGERLPAGRALSQREIGDMLDACAQDQSPSGRRDAAVIAMLYGAGLRRAEACALDLADVDLDRGEITIHHGKGDKERMVPLAQGTAAAIEDWLAVRGLDAGALFCAVHKSGRITVRHLNPQTMFDVLYKRALRAGVEHLSPHDFRRTYVSDLLEADVDIATVSRLAGHVNVETTKRYDRRGEKAKREAVARLNVPYKSEGRE